MKRRQTELRYADWRRRNLSDLGGKTAVVTGANSGLGYETVRGLLSLHARVILACRDEGRGKTALSRLLSEFPDAEATVLPLDLSRRSSIEAFAARLSGIAPRIDVFVHCAGVYYPKETVTPDGLPATVGINAVGTARLSELTLPLLSPDGRAVFVTSLVDKKGKVKNDPLSDDERSGYAAYARSKFLLSGYVYKKSVDKDRSQPLFIAAHPGITKTPLLSKEKTGPRPFWSRAGHALIYLFTQSPEKSSLPILFAAAGDAENGALYAPRGLFGVFGFPRRVPFSENVVRAVKTHPEYFDL